jgi:demethylmenaquinone methyltransferase/2-methoxy-6-polyprenyl-1,4-benzoquinol methylase
MGASRSTQAWNADGADKRAAVQRMFADIAPTYDLCNSMMSFRLHHRWRAYAVSLLNLSEGAVVADICCGTGDFFKPIRKAIGQAGRLLGVDFCAPMLEIAGAKDSLAGRALGDACRLPMQSGSVDAVTVGWGIRNVPDIDAAHREIQRILKPGGGFVSIDMAVPQNGLVRAMSNVMTLKMLPRLGSLFGKREAYTYLPKSTQTFRSREELKQSMESAGLSNVQYRDLFFGNICVHSGVKL